MADKIILKRAFLGGCALLLALTGCVSNQSTTQSAATKTVATETATTATEPPVSQATPTETAPATVAVSGGSKFLYTIDTGDMQVPEKALNLFDQSLLQTLSEKDMIAEDSKTAKIVEILVTEYYTRPVGVRVAFGVFSGKDKIYTQVSVKDPKTGEIIDTRLVRTHNRGVGFKGINHMLRVQAARIAKFLEQSG